MQINTIMKTLFIGDVCGKPGREMIRDILPNLRKKEQIDLVVANIDNLAHGIGASPETVREIMSYGVDAMTSGQHIWRKQESREVLSGEFPVARPANYPDFVEGKGMIEVDMGSKGTVLIIHLLGWVFMNDRNVLEPLNYASKMIEGIDYDKYVAIIVDFHAEATSEKLSMSYLLDGKVSALVGSHTHIPTADERILPKGTAYITDMGMVGPYNSTLWVKNDIILQQNMLPYPVKYEIEEDGERVFNAVLIEANSPKNAFGIKRIEVIK